MGDLILKICLLIDFKYFILFVCFIVDEYFRLRYFFCVCMYVLYEGWFERNGVSVGEII